MVTPVTPWRTITLQVKRKNSSKYKKGSGTRKPVQKAGGDDQGFDGTRKYFFDCSNQQEEG